LIVHRHHQAQALSWYNGIAAAEAGGFW
jgi:hypothetical protein